MESAPRHTLGQLILYFLKLGTVCFGGPVALIENMRRDLIEERKWFSEDDFKEGLALAQLAPGPMATQTAIYLGYLDHGIAGATAAVLAFILPSFLMVILLGWAYVRYGGLPWMQSVFYGVGASVIGIIAVSAKKLTEKTLGRDKLLWAVCLAAAVITIATESENVWMFLAAGVLVWWIKAPPKWGRGIGMLAVEPTLLWKIFLYFGKAGTFVFGSGLVIVPFLYGGVVKDFHWLNDRQFLDAVAVAMITPGPVVITVAFIGYLVAGMKGASVAALGTFLPCYLFTVIPAPYFKKYGKLPGIAAFVAGVTAAAMGAITGAVFVLGRRSIIDVPTALFALASAAVLWKKKLSEPVIVLIAGLIGLALKFIAI
ncbi:MAG: chromate transporter [Elusimicrobia bacterium RIFCSPLOWO2_01_FULL_60_11]|nr:MAG: chromate transporter [Elusimicrobia bacterium RIFCSPLOWO2_01_FULL_60_11]